MCGISFNVLVSTLSLPCALRNTKAYLAEAKKLSGVCWAATRPTSIDLTHYPHGGRRCHQCTTKETRSMKVQICLLFCGKVCCGVLDIYKWSNHHTNELHSSRTDNSIDNQLRNHILRRTQNLYLQDSRCSELQ